MCFFMVFEYIFVVAVLSFSLTTNKRASDLSVLFWVQKFLCQLTLRRDANVSSQAKPSHAMHTHIEN